MIKIRITWPLLLLAAFALVIWLAHRPPTPTPHPRSTRPVRPTPRARTRARRGMVIDSDEREAGDLDREAAAAARAATGGPNPYDPAIERLHHRRTQRDRAYAHA